MDGRVRLQPINHLLKLQIVVLVIIVVTVFWWRGNSAAIACLFGGSIVLANTLLQRWHLVASVRQEKSDAGMNLRRAYRCVAERWFLTIAMFVIGFAVLKLSAMALMAGFIVMQLTLLFGNLNRA